MTEEEKAKLMPSAEGRRAAKLDRDVQLKIGERLRAVYDDIVKQGVPDRFVDLLSRLDKNGRDEESTDDQ